MFEKAYTLEENEFVEARITMYSHTGTHIDAPAHMFKDGRTLDEFPIEHFVGKAAVMDFSSREIRQIEVSDLQPFQLLLTDKVEFVILRTGWSQYWGTPQYFDGFPYLTYEAATWLSQFNLKGIGIDAISIDAMDSTAFSVHKIFMQRNFLIVENLANLDSLDSKQFLFSVLPLKTKYADGAPARAIAMNCSLAM